MNGWGTPEQVAATVGRPAKTVRQWASRGQVAAACDVRSRRLLVHWASAYDRDRCAERRDTPRRRAPLDSVITRLEHASSGTAVPTSAQ